MTGASEAVPEDVKVTHEPREPKFDPTVGVPPPSATLHQGVEPAPNRLVVIGDSLSHGFQSGAIYNTDISYPAIIAHELGWSSFRYPVYGGPGGLPINIEYLLRELEERYGTDVDWWEASRALFRGRQLMDEIEDYYERGPGSRPTANARGINHNLSVFGWDLRDALSQTAATCSKAIKDASDAFLIQVVERSGERAALSVYPTAPQDSDVFEAARRLGAEQQSADGDCGIETLIVFLGANNALQAVTTLRVAWSGTGYDDPDANGSYTVWRPDHFAAEYDEVVQRVMAVGARHVIWCTVPHVTIAPIARGIGHKLPERSRDFPFYTRPWIDTGSFDPRRDPHITGDQARQVDSAIDQYNVHITEHVAAGRRDGRDWYLLDVAGLLDRLASRRYIEDPNARPPWWEPYELPATLKALRPVPDSQFLTADGEGGRAKGGLFSLDGVHPTTVGYGLIAQELINVMQLAGVAFRPGSVASASPVAVDFARLIRRDTLINRPPQNLTSGLAMLGWADETLDVVRRALSFTG
jgi:hypothetical protein